MKRGKQNNKNPSRKRKGRRRSVNNQKAKQLANLTETLFECDKEVNESCNTDNFPKPNTTLINKCNTSWNFQH